MIINNINLRNKLGMNRLMSEDNGADKESNQTEKTFTQAELDKIIEKRLQRERNK